MTHIVIAGGGISGLAALEHLTAAAPGLRYTLLERTARLGGHIRTERLNGFVMEAGPDVLLAAKPSAIDLAQRIGLSDRLQCTNSPARGSYIFDGRHLRRMPDGLTGLVPSRITPFLTTPLISPLGKLRVAAEYFISADANLADESVEHFVVRRLGRQMYDRLFEPLLSGISAGDGARLSARAMFPQLIAQEREQGGLLRAMFSAKRRSAAYHDQPRAPALERVPQRSPFVSFPTGMEELVEALQGEMRRRSASGTLIDIRLHEPIVRIERPPRPRQSAPSETTDEGANDGFVIVLASGERLLADGVIVATPAYAAADLLATVNGELASALREIEYSSTVTLSLAFQRDAVTRPLDATGYVVPRVLRRPVMACTWSSTKFAGRAPHTHALFRLFIGGVGRGSFETRPDADVLAIARNELREVLGVTADPTLVRIHRFDRAMPQYNVGHLERISRVDAFVSEVPGLALAGAAYKGLGIPDCVRSGAAAAAQVLQELAVSFAASSA